MDEKLNTIIRLLCFILGLLITHMAFAGTATVSWDPNTESDLNGYKIYYGTSSGNYDATIDAGNATNFPVTGLQNSIKYYFVVTAYDFSGNESGFSNEVNIVVTDSTEDPPVDPPIEDPISFQAYCFPNPFYNNEGTIITFITPNDGNLSIDIYTVTGRFIRNLINDLPVTKGEHQFQWDGEDKRGNQAKPGVYFGSFTLNSQTIVIKMAIKP